MPNIDYSPYFGRHSVEDIDTAIEQAALVTGKQNQLNAGQLAAVNSGITANLVGKIENINEDASNTWVKPTGTQADMSSTILSKLNTYGQCNLAEGTYYVSGFEMPIGSILRGSGKNTVIVLLSSVSNGYCVRIHRNNTISDICFSGGSDAPSDIWTEGTSLGSRHGIYLAENSDGASGESRDGSRCNIIENCFFFNFDGSGFYASNTGVALNRGVLMSNCYFEACKVGINVAYYSEYNKFDNCATYQCNVGCINNGGNNVFTACTFHGVKCFVVDNSDGDKTNNSHGAAIGCTFNHANNMSQAPGGGRGIEIVGAQMGFIFTGCQIWFSEIYIENSIGIHISDSQIAGNPATVTVIGDYGAMFQDCMFWEKPTLNVADSTVFKDCFIKGTGTSVGGVGVNSDGADVKSVDNLKKNIFRTTTGTSSDNGVTFTNNLDGTWSVSGTTTARAQKRIFFTIPDGLPSGRYVISGCPTGGRYDGSVRYALYLWDNTAMERVTPGNNDTGDGFEFDWEPDHTHIYSMNIDIRQGFNPNNLTFRPMLCSKSDWAVSQKFTPYIADGVAASEALANIVDSGSKNIVNTSQQTTTVGEVTFTNNGDGTWTTSGSEATARRYLLCSLTLPDDIESGTYVLSGCPEGGLDDTGTIKYALYLYDSTAKTRVGGSNNDDVGYGFTFEWAPIAGHTYGVIIDVRSGSNVNGLVWKPMICKKELYDISNKFVPHRYTYQEIYDMIVSMQTQ